MKRTIMGLSLAGALAVAGVAFAEMRGGINGTMCKGRTAADQQYVRYDRWGIRNDSASREIYVDCDLGYAPPTSSVKNLRAAVWSTEAGGIACDVEYRDAHGNTLTTYYSSIVSRGTRGEAEWITGPGYGTGETFGFARCLLVRRDPNYGANYLSSITWDLR